MGGFLKKKQQQQQQKTASYAHVTKAIFTFYGGHEQAMTNLSSSYSGRGSATPKALRIDTFVYRKIPKISPGAYIFQRPFLMGLSTEGNLRLKIDWTSLIVGRKFTVFALLYFIFEGNFQVQAPGGLIFGGAINGEFFALQVWGAYLWRGLFSEFYGSLRVHRIKKKEKRGLICERSRGNEAQNVISKYNFGDFLRLLYII